MAGGKASQKPDPHGQAGAKRKAAGKRQPTSKKQAAAERQASGEPQPPSKRQASGKPPAPSKQQASGEPQAPSQQQASGEPQAGAAPNVKPEQRRRAAGPARQSIAANDDSPSIGGLIYALQQQPSNRPFLVAAVISGAWLVVAATLSWAMLAPEFARAQTWLQMLAQPTVLTVAGTIIIPITLFWFLALLTWRAQELRLMSSAMTEVAVRLAEPDRMSEQAVASLGQSVRLQVAAMNEGISRALGRASELETLVHNEVSALERSYSDNELRIRGIIDELSSERAAIENNSDRVGDSIRGVGMQVTREIEQATLKASEKLNQAGEALYDNLKLNSDRTATIISDKGNSLMQSLNTVSQRISTEVPGVVHQLGQEQVRLTKLIEDAGKNLVQLQTGLSDRTGKLESSLGRQTKYLEKVLNDYKTTVDTSIMERAKSLDETLSQRMQALDAKLVERTQLIDQAFSQRVHSIDNRIAHGTRQIDEAFSSKARLVQEAMANHAKSLNESLSRQSGDLDSTLLKGVDAIQKTSERITAQSIRTIEGLAEQAEFLEDVSGGLMQKISSLTDRFAHQNASIRKTADAVESSNLKVDTVLEARQASLDNLLENMATRTSDLNQVTANYTTQLASSLGEAEKRARDITEQIAKGTEQSSRAMQVELENLQAAADAKAEQTLLGIRNKFSQVSDEVNSQLAALTGRVTDTTADMHARTSQAARDLDATRNQLKDRLNSLSTDFTDSTQHLQSSAASATHELEQTQAALKQRISSMSDQVSDTARNMMKQTDLAALEIERTQAELDKRISIMSNQLGDTTRSVRERTEQAALELEGMRSKVYEQIDKLPETTKEGSEAMRRALQNQLSAIDSLSVFARQQAHAGEISYPSQPAARPPHPQNPPVQSGAPSSASAERLHNISHNLEQQFSNRQVGAAAAGAESAQAERSGWSLGDLLARASSSGNRGYSGNQESAAASDDDFNLETISNAIDVVTAHQIWARFRAGERGVLGRHIYTDQGRHTFDDLVKRYGHEPTFKASVDRYLVDFENLLREARNRDRGGKLVERHLVSETGRVYLLLAHASGRIA